MAGHDIAVVGASAGGVQAILTLVGSLPADLPASVFIVEHLAPQPPSMLASVFARAAKLPVLTAEDGETIRPAAVYVAPADRHLLVEPGRIRVVRGPKENGHRPAIDPLFRSAAWAYGPRVVGVVLTGYLDDGTAGLWAVKTCGGVTIVQDPSNARIPDMPRNAMRAIDVDHSLPVEAIGPKLVELARQPLCPPEPRNVPATIHHEIEFSLAERPVSDMNGIGTLSAFTCPGCRGALWELQDGGLLRYRCHTGHAFSAESLLSAQDAAGEDAVYEAMRALEEKIMLLRRLAERFGERFPTLRAKQLADADALEKSVITLRNLLSGPLDADTANVAVAEKGLPNSEPLSHPA